MRWFDEIDGLLVRYWTRRSVEDRLLAATNMYDAEVPILERLAPSNCTKRFRREFVYYHVHGEEWPEWAKDKDDE